MRKISKKGIKVIIRKYLKSDQSDHLRRTFGARVVETFGPLGAKRFEHLALSLDDRRSQVKKIRDLHQLDVGVLGWCHLQTRFCHYFKIVTIIVNVVTWSLHSLMPGWGV
jgi:hypothetical protein